MKNLVVLLFVFASAAHAESLKLLNFNAGLLRMPILGDMVGEVELRSRVLPEKLEEFVNSKTPDIILLEEVWEAGHQQAVKEKLESLGYEVDVPVGARGPRNFLNLLSVPDVGYNGSTGFVLAWNKLTVARYQHSLIMNSYSYHDMLGSFDQGTGKGIVSGHFQFVKSGKVFLFIGVYTTAMDVVPATGEIQDTGDGHALAAVHLRQMKLVGKTVNKFVMPNEPVIVMGDFNAGPGLAEGNFRALENAIGAPAILPSSGASWDRQNTLVKSGRYPNDPSANIDHIFVKAPFTVQSSSLVFTELFDKTNDEHSVIQRLPLSDHFGLFVEGELQ